MAIIPGPTASVEGIVIAIGPAPEELARSLGFRSQGFAKFGDLVTALSTARSVVVIAAYPIVVRALGQVLESKYRDPAVVAVDENASFATVLAGAHHGGEELARTVAHLLGATPVITTASWVHDTLALDRIPRLALSRLPATLQARINRGDGLQLINLTGLALPDAIAQLASEGPNPVTLVLSDRHSDASLGDIRATPATLTVGIGCSTDASAQAIKDLLETTFDQHGLDLAAIDRIATIDLRQDHVGLRSLGYDIVAYPADVLATVSTPTPSTEVERFVGTPSVAEAAALLAGGDGATLIVAKVKNSEVTLAIARRGQLRGSLGVIGIGPGALDLLTPRALGVLRGANYVVGFHRYLELLEPVIERYQEVRSYPIGQEIERVSDAINLAARGNHVALVTSGDPAVYAMAQLVIEELGCDLNLRIVPGVTAAYAASAASGAIVGHDHAMISLSDLLTPWDAIEARVDAAAKADFVIAFYNPRSRQRTWQLEKAIGIIGQYRKPTTPVLVASRIERQGARCTITTLEELNLDSVDMETIVIVGATTTATNHGYLYTPRGYRVANDRH